MPQRAAPHPSSARAESSRVETFSDAVFAIALTLLVLDLRSDAPRGHLGHELATQWPGYVAYLAAFLNIAAIWCSHHDQVIATLLYAGVGFLLPLAYVALYRYLAHRPDLLAGPKAVHYCRAGTRRALLNMALYPAVVAAALVVPVAALVIFALLPAFTLALLLRSTIPTDHP